MVRQHCASGMLAHVAISSSSNQTPLLDACLGRELVGLAALRSSVVLPNKEQQRSAVEPGFLSSGSSDPLSSLIHLRQSGGVSGKSGIGPVGHLM